MSAAEITGARGAKNGTNGHGIVLISDARYSLLATHYCSRNTTPGNALPSRNSRLAPPPVEQCDTLVSTLNFFAAVAVSPPPTTVVAPAAVAFAIASAIALVEPANFSNSNTPDGPFHTIVFARPITCV